MTLKIISEEVEVRADEEKIIEKTTQVEQKKTFTISQLKRQIEECDNEITRTQERKAELQAEIDSAVEELDLTLEVKPIVAK